MTNGQIEFLTNAYEASHGRAPRGTGSWAFEMKQERPGEIFWAPSNLTVAQAKTWMRAEIKKIAPEDYAGQVEVTICS